MKYTPWVFTALFFWGGIYVRIGASAPNQTYFIWHEPFSQLPQNKRYLSRFVFALLKDNVQFQKKAEANLNYRAEIFHPPLALHKPPKGFSFVELQFRLKALEPKQRLWLAEENTQALEEGLDPYLFYAWIKITPGHQVGDIEIQVYLKKPTQKIRLWKQKVNEKNLREATLWLAAQIRRSLGGAFMGILEVRAAEKFSYSFYLNEVWLGRKAYLRVPIWEGQYRFTAYAEPQQSTQTIRQKVWEQTIQVVRSQTTTVKIQPIFQKKVSKPLVRPKDLSFSQESCIGISCRHLFYSSAGLGFFSFGLAAYFFIQEETEKDLLLRSLPSNPHAFTAEEEAKIRDSQNKQKQWNLLGTIFAGGALFFSGLSLYAYLKALSMPSPPKKNTLSFQWKGGKQTSFVQVSFRF